MRRIGSDHATRGSEPAYWDHQWEGVDVPSRVARAEVCPSDLERELARHVVAGPILEAGCGSGWVLSWQMSRGRDIVGLDFAEATLSRVRREVPGALLVVGDLEHLPFRTAAFATVISLGALEHIEHGPVVALADHVRVLAPGGALVATFPRISWIKTLNDTVALGLRRRRTYRSPRGRWVSRATQFDAAGAGAFVQYELSAGRWVSLVRECGLEVERRREVLVGAGLGEVPLLRRLRSTRSRREPDAVDEHGELSRRSATTRPPGLLRRTWVAGVDQRPTTTFERVAAWLMRKGVAHMVAIVARRTT